MSEPRDHDKIIQQALLLDTAERTRFLSQIDDEKLKAEVAFLLDDEKELTQFILQTSVGDSALGSEFRELQPGTQVSRVKIQSLIGKGGMGSVFLGFDEKLKRQVAVKSIRPEYLQNPSTRQRFIREAQILSQINHPSICHIYDYIETEWGDFLVLEYIDGSLLSEVGLTDAEKITVMIELSEALQVAHEQGIVHRDLKPDNVMITKGGRVKVLDFGIAQSIGSDPSATDGQATDRNTHKTQAGTLVGTVRYMSPEQANNQPIGTPSDLYSLGILMQELFTNQPAYEIVDSMQLLTAVQQGQRVPASDLNPGVNQLITDLTQLSPDHRPSSKATIQALQEIQNKPRQRRKRLAYSGLALVVLALVVLLSWQYQKNQRQEQAGLAYQQYMQALQETKQARQQVYLLPAHPVAAELAQLDERDQRLKTKIMADERLDDGQRQRLIGQLYLQSGDYQQAVDALESGQADARSLALAWKGLYLEKMTAYQYEQGDTSGPQAQDIRERYLKTALSYLAQLQNKGPVLQAFEMTQNQSVEAALVHLDQVIADQNWNNDAIVLKARVLAELAKTAGEAGAWDEAKKWRLETAKMYQKAIDRARSYPDYYLKLCGVHSVLHSDAIQRTGTDVETHGQAAIAACEQLLIIEPEQHKAMTALSDIHMMHAQWEMMQGQNATSTLDTALAWIEQSIQINHNAQNLWSRALIETASALQAQYQGKSPLEHLAAAYQTYDAVLELNTESMPFVVGDYLYALKIMLEWQIQAGEDFSATVAKAKALYEHGMQAPDLDKDEMKAMVVNMGIIHVAELMHAIDQNEPLEEQGQALIAYHQEALKMLGEEPNLLMNLAYVYELLVAHGDLYADEVERHLAAAEKNIDLALSQYPSHHELLMIKAKVLAAKARYGLGEVSDSMGYFEQAHKANPEHVETMRAWLELMIRNASATAIDDQVVQALLAKAMQQAPEDEAILALNEEFMGRDE